MPIKLRQNWAFGIRCYAGKYLYESPSWLQALALSGQGLALFASGTASPARGAIGLSAPRI